MFLKKKFFAENLITNSLYLTNYADGKGGV